MVRRRVALTPFAVALTPFVAAGALACGAGEPPLSSGAADLTSFAKAPRDNVPEVDALGYAIDLRAHTETKGGETFEATVNGSFVATEAIDRVVLDFEGNQIDRVRVDGNDASHSRTGARLTIETGKRKKGEPIEITIDYSGTFAQADGANPNDFTAYGGLMARQKNRAGRTIYSTLAWPYKARRWIPLRDHPKDGAMVTMRLTFPKALQVIANGVKKDDVENEDGSRTWTYEALQSMPVYDFHFAAYDDWSEEQSIAKETNVAVNTLAYSGDKKTALAIAADLPKALDYYASAFGPYRFGNAIQFLEVPIFGGGMEHATVVSLDETLFDDAGDARITAFHELAHHWSGNLVRIATWNDFWLSEGFTDYLTSRAVEEIDGIDAARTRWTSLRSRALGFDRSHALRPEGESIDVLDIFDDVSYKKGAFVLRMLEARVGRERFTSFMKEWFTTHAFSAATTDEFEKALEAKTKTDFSHFFRSFVYTAGHPTVKGAWKRVDAETVELIIDQTQNDGPENGYDLSLDVDVRTGSTTKRVTIDASSKHGSHLFASKDDPTELILDPNVAAYFTASK